VINSKSFTDFETRKHITEELHNLENLTQQNCPNVIKYYGSQYEDTNLLIF